MKYISFKSITFNCTLILFTCLTLGAFSQAFGVEMNDYCQQPPFVNTALKPNIMLALDASGSMGCTAYRQSSDRQRYCSGNTNIECNPEHEHDCSFNYGSCQIESGHDSGHCSSNHDKHCTKNSDCTRAWGDCTYTKSSTTYGTCSNDETVGCNADSVVTDCSSATATCDPVKPYEGYFDPSKSYILNAADSTYYEIAAVETCSTKYTYYCYDSKGKNGGHKCANNSSTRPADSLTDYTCTKYCTDAAERKLPGTSTCSSPLSGNWLNYVNMSRMDLLRWSLTGGTPASCVGVSAADPINYCDPRVYKNSGNAGKVGSACSDTLKLSNDGTVAAGHGCILQNLGASSASYCPSGTSTSPIKVAIPWTGRINQGLVFQFAQMQPQPRMGVYFYENNGVKPNYIYVGDFTGNNQTNDYPYQRLLTATNTTVPGGSTPTGPAMWDIMNYFAQEKPQYSGIDATASADWKSPMNDCTDSGSGKCSYVPCAKNFVLLMSDGLWNKASCNIGSPPSSVTDGPYSGSPDPVVPAYLMHKGFKNHQYNVDTSVESVYAVGMFVSTEGERALKNTALYGSFPSTTSGWPTGATGYPTDSCTISDAGANCSGTTAGSNCTTPPSEPDTYYVADDALAMRSSILDAILGMLTRASSGTAASVLASGEGSGANIVQSIFYPRHSFVDGQPNIMWVSTLQNLWYYLDPKTSNSTIRENTAESSTATSMELNLDKDYIVNYWFDPNSQVTKAKLYADANGDGAKDSPSTPTSTIDADQLKYLWEAGQMLWQKNAADRVIFTNIEDTSTLPQFVTTNLTGTTPTLQSLLNTDLGTRSTADNTTVAQNTINFVRGEDITTNTVGIVYRPRTTTMTSGGTEKVWKLGDIINSTPRIASWIALNSYDRAYADTTYTDYVKSTGYGARGTVFAGANDGMLHAFKLGSLTLFTDLYKKAELQGSNLGTESWSFIPKNALPYLQYLGDEAYCHLYYVDATPVLFDASIGKDGCSETNYWNCPKTASTWRTVLIGGMRLGGSCKATDYTGSYGVKAPATGLGYSSYFALDITDALANPDNVTAHPPKLLWEFAPTDGSLGFSTSGAAIMKINARNFTATGSTADRDKNGRWFAVLASGPTGPIDTLNHQHKGYSDQPLKLFILDLAGPGSGSAWTENTNYWVKTPSGLNNAFGGSIYNGNIDYDIDYQDDALYVGYTKAEKDTPDSTTYWTDGGILRLVTREDMDGSTLATTALDPTNWEPSIVRSGIGPMTSSVGHLAHYSTKSTTPDKAYLYAGTGRYYFNTVSATDDSTSQRAIYGITEPCLSKILNNITCDTSNTGTLGNATSSAAGAAAADYPSGWYINLDAAAGKNSSERIITDPLAAPTGAVFFTSFAPTSDVCSFSGKSYLWAVKYDTGGAVASYLRGVGLLQVSTGAIEEVNLSTDFGIESDPIHKYGRRSEEMSGVPPLGQGLALVVPPKPTNKILHIRKK